MSLMPLIKGSFFLKLVCILLAAAVLAGGVVVGMERMGEADRLMREELGRQARLIAESIRHDNFLTLSGTAEDIELPEYRRLKEQLGAAMAAFPDGRRMSIVGARPDGSLFLFVNSEPGNGDLPGALYGATGPGLSVDAGVILDGLFPAVGYFPLVNHETGAVNAFLVLEATGDSWKRDVRRAAVLPIAAGVMLAAALIGAYAVLLAVNRPGYAEAGIVLLIGIILTASFAHLTHEKENFDRGKAFSAIADARSGRLKILFDDIRDLALTSLVWYMESSEEVLEDEFEHFTKHLKGLPEVEVVEWIPVPEDGDFSASRDPGREAMALAAATGLPSSSKVTARNESGGVIQELRIFKSAADRKESGRLMGLASFTLRLDAFIKKTLSGGERDLVMRLWELDGNGAALIAGSFDPAAPPLFQGMKISVVTPLYSVRPIFAFGRTFVAEMLPGPDFLIHHPQRQGMGTLTMGLLISVLAAAAVGGALRRSELLEKKVQSRTVELKESMDRLQLADQIFRTTTEGILITDADGLIEDGNLALERLTGYSLDEIRGKNPDIFGVQKTNPDSSAGFWSQLKEAGVWQGEVLNRRKTGEVYPVWLTVSAVKDEEGEVTHFAGVLTYIGDIKAEQERLSRLAYHDPLTDLPNRHLLMDRLEMAIARAGRSGALAAAVFIDLDGFKAVNDTWGHETGDLLLMAVAEGLKGAVREQDTVARLGGDEFITVLDGFSYPEEIDVLLSRINDVFSNPFIAGNRSISIRASLGAAIYPDDGTTANQLIAKADELMYARKLKGRGGSR